MKKIVFALLAGLLTASPGFATMLDINLLGGMKQLSHTDWGDNDMHGAAGLEAVVSPPAMPLSFVGGYLYTTDTEDQSVTISGGGVQTEEVEGVTEEWYLGIGKKFDLPVIHFLISGGPAFLQAKKDNASTLSSNFTTDDDEGFGYYLAGSAFFQVFGHINLGAMIRYSAANVDLNGREVKAGGLSYLGLLGIGF